MRLLFAFIVLFSFPIVSVANLDRSAVTSMNTNIYGLYTSSDPLCLSGFVPTLALQASPRAVDMARNPTFGSGRIANPVRCVALVMKNQVLMGWSAGSYSGADAACNGGGSVSQVICRDNGGGPVAVDWPGEITADMALLGLTRTTSCTAAATGNEIVAVFLSASSACTGNAVFDAATAGCGNANSFQAPTMVSDTTKGVRLAVRSGYSQYRLVIDPSLSLGGSGGTCMNVSPPTFSLK